MDSSRESRGQQQFQEKKMQVYQSKDRLDMEIEELRLLMVKMSQRRHEERMKIFVSRGKKQNNKRRQMTEGDGRSKASGAWQHKIWKLGELKMTKKMDDLLQNKVWDLGILKIEGYGQRSYLFLPGESDAGASLSPSKFKFKF